MPKYKVTGPFEVLDHQPGEVFEIKIDPVMEARLIAGGHIERVEEKELDKQDEPRHVGQPRDNEATDRADELERELEA